MRLSLSGWVWKGLLEASGISGFLCLRLWDFSEFLVVFIVSVVGTFSIMPVFLYLVSGVWKGLLEASSISGFLCLRDFSHAFAFAIFSVWTFPDLPNKYILQSEQIYFDIWAKTFKYRFLRNLSGLSNRVFIYSMDYFRRVRFQFLKLPVVHHTS